MTVEENLLTSEREINPVETRINQNQGRGMSGKKHSPESRKAISKTQKARYDLLRMAVEKATNEDRIREVVKEEIQKLIDESKPVNNKHNNIPL